MNPTEWKRDETPKNVFNPLNDDVSVRYRNDKNEEKSIIVPFFKSTTYPTYLADHIIKHLVDAIIIDRKLGYVTPEKRAEIQKEVEV